MPPVPIEWGVLYWHQGRFADLERRLLGPAVLAAVPVLSAGGVPIEVCQMSLVLCPWTGGVPYRVPSSLS